MTQRCEALTGYLTELESDEALKESFEEDKEILTRARMSEEIGNVKTNAERIAGALAG